MKIGSIGSCLSNMVVNRLIKRFNGDKRFHVYRHRSDQFYHYYVKKDKIIVPRSYIEKTLIVEKNESIDPNFVSSSEMLDNQYEKIGKHGVVHHKSFFDILKEEHLDIIVLDNYLDMAAILSYPKLKGYESSPIFLRKNDYSNFDDYFTFGENLSVHSVVYFVAFSVPLTTIAIYISSNEKRTRDILKDIAKIPLFHALVIALVFSQLEIPVPRVLEKSLGLAAQAAIPLLIFILGLQLSRIRIT